MRVMSLLGTLVLSACSVVGIRSGTEEPRHAVVDRVGDAEVREYRPRLAAETTVPGSAEAARVEGFRRLAAYIFGANGREARIDMTAPVAQAGAGERIAMTAPVAQGAAGPDGWTIRFFLPAALTDPPAPRDGRVRVVAVPAETVAVLRFAGLPRDDAIAAERARLLRLLDGSPWAASGPPVAWFYDPPWTLPPLRRNEVAVPVARRAP